MRWTPSRINLRGEERDWVTKLSSELKFKSASPGSPYVPLFEALGRQYFKKRIQNQRLVAYRMDVETSYGRAPVVVLLELYSRADPRYENGKVEKLSERFDPLLANRRNNIIQWAENLLQHQTQRISLPLPELPERLNVLLEPIQFNSKGTGIFQSPLWNEEFRNASSTLKNQVYKGLYKLVGSSHEEWCKTKQDHEDIVIHFVKLPDLSSRLSRYYLLGFTASNWSPSDQNSNMQKIEENWIDFQNQVVLPLQMAWEDSSQDITKLSRELIDRISRFSSCTYPDYLLCDPELWEELVTNNSVLLPLSSEELNALEQLFLGERFPGIIEGRAGSGKTTLLTYYVPERLVRLPSDESELGQDYRLLYLAENRKLLNTAQEIIDRLKSKLKDEYNVR